MKQRIVLSIILIYLVFLSGCNYHNSYKSKIVSKQETMPINQERGKNFVRSITMYEQFELVGRFAALWVPDSIRQSCIKDIISFYLLSLNDVHFNEPSSVWKIRLLINDQYYEPTMIQKVSLPLAYQLFFGPHFSQYNTVYLTTFKAISEGKALLQPNTSMKLEINFEDRQGHMVWNFDERAVLMPHFETPYRKGN